jgi:hypothetical protein
MHDVYTPRYLTDLKASGQQPESWGWIVGRVDAVDAADVDALRTATLVHDITVVEV